jgi:hypothetical protein
MLMKEGRWDGLDRFIAWLETKDPNEQYSWSSCAQCLFAQYGEFIGEGLNQAADSIFPQAPQIASAIYAYIGMPPRVITEENPLFGESRDVGTFGEALERAKRVKAMPTILMRYFPDTGPADRWIPHELEALNSVRLELGLDPISDD